MRQFHDAALPWSQTCRDGRCYCGYTKVGGWYSVRYIWLTINSYRLSILGFPGNPTGPQNLGLLDQRLAIEWVRDNIENFGGDPSRIILFGQSAGGASTDFYSYAWSSDPIISGLIVQSGSATSWGLPYTPDVDAAAWYNVSAAVGCGDSASDPNTVLSCMRSTNYSSIIKAIPVSIGLNSVLSIFGPTIDEKVVFSSNSKRTPAPLPLLLGSTHYESGLFRTRLALKGSCSQMTSGRTPTYNSLPAPGESAPKLPLLLAIPPGDIVISVNSPTLPLARMRARGMVLSST